jgi:glutamine---fructose-6-phosphate transaminase (isomerizing)
MCGIIGAIANRPVSDILLAGLAKLEYRGYDSAGITTLETNTLSTTKAKGKVSELNKALQNKELSGTSGVGHTRWATHGAPCEKNAHPHESCDSISIVHNGIIENYQELKTKLQKEGYVFKSDTDTEVVAHLLESIIANQKNTITALRELCSKIQGAYALGIIIKNQPDTLYAVRCNSPLIIGAGIKENFISSDLAALLPVTPNYMILEEGDIACITTDNIEIYNQQGNQVTRAITESTEQVLATSKENYRHFMQKEIHQQPSTIQDTLANYTHNDETLISAFGEQAQQYFQTAKRVHLIACGTSFHAAMTARYWIESIANIPCQVDIASEYRYRDIAVTPGTLFVAFSQSGETADTLAALAIAKKYNYLATLGICNIPTSTLVRETDLRFITKAGIEIGVAATKTFTAQLVAALLLAYALAKYNKLDNTKELPLLETAPSHISKLLELNNTIAEIASDFANCTSALYIGRNDLYPIAMEGALKLKEISYIHAEAYAAGELKHGALALIDEKMPVIVLAPSNSLFEKTCANIQEIKARGGNVYVITDNKDYFKQQDVTIIPMPTMHKSLQPLLYTIPMQLLSYHIAVIKGTDVDQPRNLAKSVTVE